MNKVKKIAVVVFSISLLTGLMISMGFVNEQQSIMPYNTLEINVNQDNELYFLDKNDILGMLQTRGDSVIGLPREKVNIPEIEDAINSHENVANAEVFSTIDGKMKIKVKQRKPIVRVFNMVGESYYIDEDGMLMPISEKYTANVPIANGYIFESYARYYNRPVYPAKGEPLAKQANRLSQIYALSRYIDTSAFWKNQIQQIYINENHDIELIPLAGNHKIIFGDTTLLAEKFENLNIFYLKGLNVTGWWNRYSTINVKFKNQIVCTRNN